MRRKCLADRLIIVCDKWLFQIVPQSCVQCRLNRIFVESSRFVIVSVPVLLHHAIPDLDNRLGFCKSGIQLVKSISETDMCSKSHVIGDFLLGCAGFQVNPSDLVVLHSVLLKLLCLLFAMSIRYHTFIDLSTSILNFFGKFMRSFPK